MNAQPDPDLLAQLRFDNTFTATLPADPRTDTLRREVSGACFSRVSPTAVRAPRLLAWSREVAADIGLLLPADGQLSARNAARLAEVFGGNRVLPGMDPHACCYGGHQFGNWAGQLGDGRAINLGEVLGANDTRWMLQLKGSGPTPYSRGADGLAVLRSSVREFLCSEAMHHLGVPTTRALSLVGTGEAVLRDMLYDGNPRHEPGAVVCRVAPSFVRFGSFEILAARGDRALLGRLADHTIRTHFPHLGEPDREVYLAWFEEICRRTATMVAHWMRVGFVHGVMNTDNMSILGLTIDYGPYGWLEDYDPDWTPNTTDAEGRRYRYGQQPQVALWNLLRLANAIHPLIDAVEPLQAALASFQTQFDADWGAMLAAKLGLAALRDADDLALVADLQALLGSAETDMTLFYRQLAEVDVDADGLDDARLAAPLAEASYDPGGLHGEQLRRTAAWLRRYVARVRDEGLPAPQRRARMQAVNPRFVLRNYLAQLAIDRAEQQDDPSMIMELLEVLRRPYVEQPEHAAYAARRPEWARHRVGCSMLSCSS